jgi:hypothetical protein
MALAGFVSSIKAAMNKAAEEHSSLSREAIVDRMNAISETAGVKITGGNSKKLSLATFEKWLNPADRERVPGTLALNVFCVAVDDYRPLEVQLRLHGLGVLNAEDRRLRDYAKAIIEEKKARKRKRDLEAKL